jgi:hypothetical protein
VQCVGLKSKLKRNDIMAKKEHPLESYLGTPKDTDLVWSVKAIKTGAIASYRAGKAGFKLAGQATQKIHNWLGSRKKKGGMVIKSN